MVNPPTCHIPYSMGDPNSRPISSVSGRKSFDNFPPFTGAEVSNGGDVKSTCFLTVPSSPRRPSTADALIRKLKVERVEGGGLSVSGVALAANCHLTLIIFGGIFLAAGLVLSYVAYATKQPVVAVAQAAGAPNGTFQKPNTHKQMQVIGPVFMVGGVLMLLIGLSMYAIGKKIRRDEKEERAMLSVIQQQQLENNFTFAQTRNCGSPMRTFTPPVNESQPILSIRRGSWWIEPTPVEDATSNYGVSPPSYSYASRSPSPLNESGPNPLSPEKQRTIQVDTQRPTSVTVMHPITEKDIATFPDNFETPSMSQSTHRRNSAASKSSNQDCQRIHDKRKRLSIGTFSQLSKDSDDSVVATEPGKDFQIPEIHVTPSSQDSIYKVGLPRHSRHCMSATTEPS